MDIIGEEAVGVVVVVFVSVLVVVVVRSMGRVYNHTMIAKLALVSSNGASHTGEDTSGGSMPAVVAVGFPADMKAVDLNRSKQSSPHKR
jgi:Na+-transporting methylmalonyl-CoA/oxaloacetate decarboxylase gamma subunit